MQFNIRLVVHGFIEVVMIVTALYPKDGICYNQIASFNDTNVDLVFKFNKTKNLDIWCFKLEDIGHCFVFDGMSHCNTFDAKVFQLSATVGNMVELTLRIIFLNESMTGNYSCYEMDIGNRQTVSVGTPVNLTSLIMDPNVNTLYPKYNETSIFTCTTSPSRPRAVIHWFEDGHNITNMSRVTYVSDVATSVLKYKPTTHGETKLSCAAVYTYKTVNISITRTTTAYVYFAVSIPTVSINGVNVSRTINVQEGVTMGFQCSTDGYPPPTYQWSLQGHSSGGPFLELQLNRTETGSTLRCSVSNTFLTMDGSINAPSFAKWTEITLNVLYKPDKPTFYLRTCNNSIAPLNGYLQLVEGDIFEVVCRTRGNPTPSIDWIPSLDGNDNILRASNVSSAQSGTYTCVAENDMNIIDVGQDVVGSNNATLLLYILAPPNTPKQVHVVANSITENSVKIEWVPSNDGGIPHTFTVLWRKEGMIFWNAVNIPSSGTRFDIQGLESGSKFEFKILAENAAGKSYTTEIIMFETDTSAPVASIIGGVLGGGTGLVIMCALALLLYRKYPTIIGKRSLPNTYEDVTKNRTSTMDIENYCEPESTTGSEHECYVETGFHGNSNPTYLSDESREQEESYEYVANDQSVRTELTLAPKGDSNIYSNVPGH